MQGGNIPPGPLWPCVLIPGVSDEVTDLVVSGSTNTSVYWVAVRTIHAPSPLCL